MRQHYWMILSAALILSGPACGGAPGGGNINPGGNTNSNADARGGVSFPEVTGENSPILAIEEDDGISARILGSESTPGAPASVTGLSGETGDGEFSAEFDEELRTERLTVGEGNIDFEYGDDDTFSFSVNRGEETIFSGDDLSVSRETSGAGRVAQQVGRDDIAVCAETWISGLAILIEQEVTGDSSAVPDPQFTQCLQDIPELQRVSAVLCVTTLVFVPSLLEAFQQCTLFADPIACFDRSVPALEAVGFLGEILTIVLEDIVRQIRLNGGIC